MKKIVFLLFVLTLLPAHAHAAAKYVIDRKHANITWTVNHYGFSNVSGTFTDVSGTLIFDRVVPTTSKVDVIIKTGSIQTAVPKLTRHLKGEDFFFVDAFPEARFVSTNIKVTGKTHGIIEGNLTLHGKTRPVTLKAEFNKEGVGASGKRTIGFSLTGRIKRSDFEMNYGLPDIGDKVDLRIEVEAINENDVLMDMR